MAKDGELGCWDGGGKVGIEATMNGVEEIPGGSTKSIVAVEIAEVEEHICRPEL